MLITEFDFDLPQKLIAQQPADRRDSARMLAVDISSGTITDSLFANLSNLLIEGDVLVVNNTKVFPARLIGRSETGAKIEIFLVRLIGENVWLTLAKPARRLPVGKNVIFSDDLTGTVVGKHDDGKLEIKFETDGEFETIIDRIGKTPLPPYIKRPDQLDEDRQRYQTVYAAHRGAIAAPTAGLHFDEATFKMLEAKGVSVEQITLHVGYGTFEPVKVSDLAEHSVSPEYYEITHETASAITESKKAGKRVIAVGTTTTRALESSTSEAGVVASGKGFTSLTILPGYKFKAVDGLLTNFHLPQSSLLVLVSAFGGYQLIMDAYKHAVNKEYRFYSYGDCMLIT